MYCPVRLCAAAIGRLPQPFRSGFIGAAVAIATLLQGCASQPPAESVAAADPAAPAVGTSYRPVLGGYSSARPAEPAAWRERNEPAAPKRSGP